jgi:hypothetical protein
MIPNGDGLSTFSLSSPEVISMRPVAALAAAAIWLLSVPALAVEEGLPADPRGAQAGRLDTRDRQAVAALARNAGTAQALGNLATKRASGGRLGELGQSMALTNAGLAQQLAQLAGPENMPLRERADQGELQRLQAMGSDRESFGRELVGWITAHYPASIRNLEMLSRGDPRYATLAETALPQLRQQLSVAQEIAQAAIQTPDQQAQRPAAPQ